MVKNPPSNAGDMGSMPGRRTKIPHALGKEEPAIMKTQRTPLPPKKECIYV